MLEIRTSILIVGGGVGGCAAALAATSMGVQVVMTEPTDWIGGQLTSQAVPPDEHPWIEKDGCTARYQQFRQSVRDYYRKHYPLSSAAASEPWLNPGGGTVSGLCHEPRVALAVLEQQLMSARSAGLLRVLNHHRPVGADVDGDRVRSVTFTDKHTGRTLTITADIVLDATELGDLLPLAGVEYVSGAESRADTGELHAIDGPAQPENVQALTWCLPLRYDPTPNADHTLDKPSQYDRWHGYVPDLTPPWAGPLIGWEASHAITLEPRRFNLFGDLSLNDFSSLWHYRRIVAGEYYDAGHQPHEVTLVNWPQNDYLEGNIIDKPDAVVAEHLEAAKQLSLSLVYWMQTEAPRHDGGEGYPGLSLCPELVGTMDGLAQAPYIRESRRIVSMSRVTETHIGYEARDGRPAELFHDSVGVGYYRIDLHPSTAGNNYIDIPSMPFQIPLGALIPVRVENLLAACKNIGVTHITNGCYRLHPVEWNIGESAGLLAAHCLLNGLCPQQVRNDPARLEELQTLLVSQGIALAWPDTIIEEHLESFQVGATS